MNVRALLPVAAWEQSLAASQSMRYKSAEHVSGTIRAAQNTEQCDAHLLRPNKGATEPMMPILTAMRPTSSDSTMFHSCSSRLTSMLAPVVTKNSPSSIPRNGLMSASTCTCTA